MSMRTDLRDKMASGPDLPDGPLALPGLDADTDGGTVSVTLTAQDLDDLSHAIDTALREEGECEWVADRTARLATLAAHMRTIRAALP